MYCFADQVKQGSGRTILTSIRALHTASRVPSVRHLFGRDITLSFCIPPNICLDVSRTLSFTGRFLSQLLLFSGDRCSDDDDDDDESIEKRNSSSSLRREPSSTRTLKWPGRSRVQISCNTSGAHHVQRAVCHVTRRDSSATKFNSV